MSSETSSEVARRGTTSLVSSAYPPPLLERSTAHPGSRRMRLDLLSCQSTDDNFPRTVWITRSVHSPEQHAASPISGANQPRSFLEFHEPVGHGSVRDNHSRQRKLLRQTRRQPNWRGRRRNICPRRYSDRSFRSPWHLHASLRQWRHLAGTNSPLRAWRVHQFQRVDFDLPIRGQRLPDFRIHCRTLPTNQWKYGDTPHLARSILISGQPLVR